MNVQLPDVLGLLVLVLLGGWCAWSFVKHFNAHCVEQARSIRELQEMFRKRQDNDG